MRTLSNREATIVLGLLVEQLGGEAVLTAEQVRTFDLEVESVYDPMTMKTTITARRKPETVEGEIVTAEPQSIEPPRMVSRGHACEAWQIIRGDDGIRYCTACGKSS